tara:strand:+ start:508 stop:1017 length:510 start_codon:yes stop_codon:yes gene_type:complete
MQTTGSEKLAKKQRRLSKRGTIAAQIQAQNLATATADPTKAGLSDQEKAAQGMEGAASYGAAVAPAVQQAAETMLAGGDKGALMDVATTIQAGGTDAAKQTVGQANMQDMQMKENVEQKRGQALQAALQEKLRKKEEFTKDAAFAMKTAEQLGKSATGVGTFLDELPGI